MTAVTAEEVFERSARALEARLASRAAAFGGELKGAEVSG
jgi:hypothetical protein